MSELSIQLVELCEEYFNEYSPEQLVEFHTQLDNTKTYTSDELIKMLANWSDKRNLRGIK